MNKRIPVIFFSMMLGLLLPTAVSRTFLSAAAIDSREPQSPTALDGVRLSI